MQRFPTVSAIIMVVGLAVSAYVSRQMNVGRTDAAKFNLTTPARAKMVYRPMFGIDKFYADIKWMTTINSLGKEKTIDKDKAAFFYDQFNLITNLDPDFDSVYRTGAATIAYQDITKALALIQKGEKCARKADWNWLYQAAHWILQVQAANEKDDAQRKKFQDEAIEYLRKAVALNAPWYVENMLLHTQAKREDKYGEPLPELEAWFDYYKKRLAELQPMMGGPDMPPEAVGQPGKTPDGKAPAPAVKPAPDMALAPMAGVGADGQDSVLTRLRERILERCRTHMRTLLDSEAKADSADAKAKVAEDEAKVRDIYKEMNPGVHYAPRSLATYDAGDLYDPFTGSPITPFGIDLYDYEVNEKITALKGDFNTRTGKPAAGTFEALDTLLKKEGKTVTRLAAHRPEKTGQ